MSNAETERKIAELNRQFRGGAGLDRDVLLAVLELHQGDVQQTVAFLQAGEGHMVDPGPAADGLPANYMTKPANWQQPKAVNSEVAPESLEGRTIALKQQLMSSETPFVTHCTLLRDNQDWYIAMILLLVEQGVDLPAPSKAKILAAAWAHGKNELAKYLLARPNYAFGLPEVLRAVKLLDLPRRIRQFETKLHRLEHEEGAKARTVRTIRLKMADVAREYAKEQVTSFNGSMAKRVKQWVRSIPAEHLQFFALQMPKEPWKELSDLCHFSPKDFQVPWFLSVMFGQEPPADSLLRVGNITPANVRELVAKFKIPYSFLRKQVENLSSDVKGMVASYEKLSMVIWYYEELECPETDAVLTQRLEKGEDPELPYGKLMERILFMKMGNKPFYQLLLPIAERRLKAIKLPLEPPVVVFGDASYSMDVAIRVSTIIASLLTVLADADIFFFNVNSFAPPQQPATIPQVLDVALNTKADGLTATACTLRRYYDERKPVKFFIMVTDEIENEPSNGTFFAQLFYRYYVEVHPARLVMVSFLEDPNQKGRMVRALESFGIVPLQFRLDAKRPDLTKLDSLLGLLAAECNFFSVQVEAVSKALRSGASVDQLVTQIREGPDAMKKHVDGNSNNNNNNNAPVAGKGKEEEQRSAVRQFRAQLQLSASQEAAIPPEFVCPISSEIMEDPVVAADGNSYERASIAAWFEGHLTSPLTNAPMPTKMLFPNYALRTQINEWVAQRLKK